MLWNEATLSRHRPLGCGFLAKNIVSLRLVERDRLADRSRLQINFFSRDPLEIRAQSGFRESGLCKIWFSKNLDTKILITHDLGARHLASPNCHGLDHCRAVLNCGTRSDVTMRLWKTVEDERFLG
jgi:hypothetical protein